MKTKDAVDYKIVIQKQPDDPEGIIRVSLGGIPGAGGYCVYRGTKEEAIELMSLMRLALAKMAELLGDKEPDTVPDEPDPTVQ